MSRARHHGKERAKGGKVAVYAGADSNVLKEAHERKRGGRVEGEGEEPKHHAGKHHRGKKHGGKVEQEYKRGGHAKRATGGAVKRARGGAVGSDKRPLSSAAHITEVKGESKRKGE